MKKIKSAFLVMSILSFLIQPIAFGACDKVKKACSISDLNKITQNTELKKTTPKEQPQKNKSFTVSIKSWLKSLR